MALRKYIYTFNGVPYSLDLDIGDPEGTEVINLGEIADKANVPITLPKLEFDTSAIYTKTAVGFSGGSSFTDVDFSTLELLDIQGMIMKVKLDDPNYSIKRKALDNQYNQKLLDILLKETYDLQREQERYKATYGGDLVLTNELKKTLGYVSTASSIIIPLVASQAANTALATGASIAIANAAGAAVTASFTAVFSSIMPVLGLAIIGLSAVEKSYYDAGKARLKEYILQKQANIKDAMTSLLEKIKLDENYKYTSIYIPELPEEELNKIVDQITKGPVNSSPTTSKTLYWLILLALIVLIILIRKRRLT